MDQLDSTHIYYQFERLIEEIFEINGYDVISGTTSIYRDEFDSIIIKDDLKYIVEVKAYRSRSVSLSILIKAIERLVANILGQNYRTYSGGILVITSNINPDIKNQLTQKYQIEIIDRGKLLYLTRNNLPVRIKLENILLQLSQTGEDDIFEGIYKPETAYKIDFINFLPLEWQNYQEKDDGYEEEGYEEEGYEEEVESDKEEPDAFKNGKIIYDKISLIKAGDDFSTKFEEWCKEILIYLFGNDLSLWIEQQTTTDRLHRFDLITRILPKNDFWKSLYRDFHSRFVVFEFKNYTSPIKQGQIYTTEKYLYRTALRSIAFIISRKGADKNAKIAMEGALRENGKLIVCLDLKDLKAMIELKDSGSDPNDFLSERVDSILLSLSR